MVKYTKTDKRLKEYLNKVSDLLKAKKWTSIGKQVTIKEIEGNIVKLSAKPSSN